MEGSLVGLCLMFFVVAGLVSAGLVRALTYVFDWRALIWFLLVIGCILTSAGALMLGAEFFIPSIVSPFVAIGSSAIVGLGTGILLATIRTLRRGGRSLSHR